MKSNGKFLKVVIVIGGGPAGMMSAINSASGGQKIILLEKNAHLGRKLLLTGCGRCNLTNVCNMDEMIDHFSKTGSFLRDAFKKFDNKKLINFFKERGLKIKIEDNGRAFPITDKALSVLKVLERELKEKNVKILFNKSAKSIILYEDSVKGVLCEDGSTINADKVIVATGGLSYKWTGATGDGIRMAENMGHKIITPKPGLVSLKLKGSVLPKSLEGLSIDGVSLIFRADKKKIISDIGSLLFTRDGISGPVTLASSSKVVRWLNRGEEVSLSIDFIPRKDFKATEEMLIRMFAQSSAKSLKNILKELVPSRMADMLLQSAGICPDKKGNQITSKERKEIVMLLKKFDYSVLPGILFEKAQITCGGVTTREIDPKTMESKKIKGLYFAGEVIDVDGESGGFNLQAAFSTGFLAGQ